MDYKALIGALFLSIFSTGIMSYIAMAMPIGPWIAPTLVLMSMVIAACLRVHLSTPSLVYMTAAGSIGGIVATAFGFSFPTLFFLDHAAFLELIATPLQCALPIFLLAIAGSLFGIFVANMYEESMLADPHMTFPIGQLVHSMITAGRQTANTYALVAGFLGTIIFCILQNGLWFMKASVAKSIVLVRSMQYGILAIPTISFDLWPMLWAIGFITGHMIAVPLAIGAIAKIILVDSVHRFAFSHLSSIAFSFSFASGMVLFSTLHGFWGAPALLRKIYVSWKSRQPSEKKYFRTSHAMLEQGILLTIVCICLWFLNFGVLAQVYLLCTTLLFTHQMVIIGGKWGIAPLGRFATFVMVPAMLLFKLSAMSIVCIATFVEAAGGSAVDIFFGRKMGQLAHLPMRKIRCYQYLGILISSIAIGFIFWILMTHMELGSSQLFAYKAQSRYLLINALTNTAGFSWYAIGLGALFCIVLQLVKVNPMLVLGGLLMPINLSLGLVAGALLSVCLPKRPYWEPFWSGVFAANSLWMIIQSLR